MTTAPTVEDENKIGRSTCVGWFAVFRTRDWGGVSKVFMNTTFK